MNSLLVLVLLASAANSIIAQTTFSISTDKAIYRYGDNINVTVSAVNSGDAPDTLRFTSCLQADYLIDSSDWLQGHTHCTAVTYRIIAPHDSTVWGPDFFWPDSGIAPLTVGMHAVIGEVFGYWTSDTLWITVSSVTGVKNPVDNPDRYDIGTNYPNPFNPITRLDYHLPTVSKVHLVIYNVLGQTISDLVNEIQSPGYKSAEWNATGVASGIYFYRLDAVSVSDPSKAFTQVRKMILLR